jgi:alginate O-acetyltransferase complex protein AlgI
MNLLSILYGVFLCGVLAIYWVLEARSQRLWVLLLASLIFYSSLQVQYVPLLVVMALVTFRVGLELGAPLDWRIDNVEWEFAQQDWSRRRWMLLWLGVAVNVLLLLGFKYVPFLLSTLGLVVDWPLAQIGADWVMANLIAPLGISFFSFECIAYLVDVYRGAPASQSFLKFASYKLFFPKLISGPITRFHPFIQEVQTAQFPSTVKIVDGLWLIASGAIKKLLLADHLGTLVDLSFANLERAGSVDLWLAAIAYGFQLYLDFSGYVDVARGTAMLLGFNLPENFNFPYLTTNIADFWRRWHMTLGDWLRNYLYFPLGGSRQGLLRTCLNLMIVMLIAGIWHGAAWGFIVWGVLHGLALVVHRLTHTLSGRSLALQQWWQSVPGTVCAWGLTQAMVFFTWIFFRLPNLRESWWVITHLWGHPADVQFGQKIYVETLQMGRLEIAVALGAIAFTMMAIYGVQRGLKLQLNWPVKILLVPVCLFAAWLLAPNEASPYIYFDF